MVMTISSLAVPIAWAAVNVNGVLAVLLGVAARAAGLMHVPVKALD
jgi:hypothetical protein